MTIPITDTYERSSHCLGEYLKRPIRVVGFGILICANAADACTLDSLLRLPLERLLLMEITEPRIPTGVNTRSLTPQHAPTDGKLHAS